MGSEVMPDIARQDRTGQPEVIYGPGKSPEQVRSMARALNGAGVRPILVSRPTPGQVEAILEDYQEAQYHERGNVIVIRALDPRPVGRLAVVAAGTADLPVADEAAVVAEAFGMEVERITDVGVAGIHRVMQRVPTLEEMHCVIVVAGMEGALPSVIAGLIRAPVIAVPTSVGYGASFDGLAALLGMLSSCVPGIVTVNIDSGLGAAMAAHRILQGR